jgi:hypothetical protein
MPIMLGAVVLAMWNTPMSPVISTGAPISSMHSRAAAATGSSSSLTNPPGKHQSP